MGGIAKGNEKQRMVGGITGSLVKFKSQPIKKLTLYE